MPTFPTLLTPTNISPFIYMEQTAKYEFDKGYYSCRPLYHRMLRKFSWEYKGLNYDDMCIFLNFIESIQGGSTYFDIIWPASRGFTVTNATNTTPITITTQYNHSFFTGETVIVSGVDGNTNANGTFTISNVTPTSFVLVGSVGNGVFSDPDTNAKVRFKISNVQLITNDDLYTDIEKILGPFHDTSGIFTMLFNFVERY
jgi:hypothetical protein